jgi:hypothetical protein
MGRGNDAKIQEFGARLVAQWVGAQGAGEDSLFRPFGELEDPNFVVEVLHLSPDRAEELEAGGHACPRSAGLVIPWYSRKGANVCAPAPCRVGATLHAHALSRGLLGLPVGEFAEAESRVSHSARA